MRALLTLAILLLFIPAPAGDVWSIEHHRGLAATQRGKLTVTLYGNRVFSHAFPEAPGSIFSRKVPNSATVALTITVTESPGMEWGSNPMGESVPNLPATVGLILQHDWHSASGRWFSTARITLSPGSRRIVVPVKPWAWTNVYGKPGNHSTGHRTKWCEAWTTPSRLGICAGGNFYAHGIESLKGSATIKVNSLRIHF